MGNTPEPGINTISINRINRAKECPHAPSAKT